MWDWFRSLPGQIMVWMALAALAAMIVTAMEGYQCAKMAIQEIQVKHLQSLLELKKAQLEGWLTEVTGDMQVLANESCRVQNCENTAENGLKNLLTRPCMRQRNFSSRTSQYDCMVQYDTRWNRVSEMAACCSSPRPAHLEEIRNRLEKGESLVVGPVRRNKEGNSCLIAGSIIYDLAGEPAGYLVASLNLTQGLQPFLTDESGMGKTGKVWLLSGDGRFLATPPAQDEEKAAAPLRKLFAQPELQVMTYRDAQGKEVLGSARRIPRLGWWIVVEKESGEVFSWLEVLKNRAVLTTLVTFIGVLGLALLGSWKLSRPMRILASVASSISQGRTEERMPRLHGREEAEVVRAFNHMLDELAASQQRLVQAASLAAVGELSSTIAHEIRNPLSSIKLNLQAFQRKFSPPDSYHELAEIALAQCIRIEGMLIELLNYTRPVEQKAQWITLSQLSRDALDSLHNEADAKKVRVQFQDEMPGEQVKADGEQIRRVLVNLVLNAIQATPAEGEVALRIFPWTNGSRDVRIQVTDTGPGIPEDRREIIFKPFVSFRQGGIGLGLPTVRKIVDAHQGKVWVEDRSGGGAIVTVSLPLERRAG